MPPSDTRTRGASSGPLEREDAAAVVIAATLPRGRFQAWRARSRRIGRAPSGAALDARCPAGSDGGAMGDGRGGGPRARVGQTLRGKWHLDGLLGSGGMASVYAATHRNAK